MSTTAHTDKTARFAAVLVKKGTGKPIGLMVPDSSERHARGFCKHFNRRIRARWPDRKAVPVPVL